MLTLIEDSCLIAINFQYVTMQQFVSRRQKDYVILYTFYVCDINILFLE